MQVALHTHFNHPNEISWVTREAAQLLMSNGVVVRNQSVLLRGVNDDVHTMGKLIRELADMNIQPVSLSHLSFTCLKSEAAANLGNKVLHLPMRPSPQYRRPPHPVVHDPTHRTTTPRLHCRIHGAVFRRRPPRRRGKTIGDFISEL